MTPALAPRTALFLPASNDRALAKARTLPVDMVILDLEDAVRAEDKVLAREAARNADGFGGRLLAIRVNAGELYAADCEAVAGSQAAYVILPKAESPDAIADLHARTGRPVLAMIETPQAVLNAAHIAAAPGAAGLIAGTNDLAAELRLPPGAGREPLALSLQTVVLAARSRGLWALDGVFNALDDPDGLAAEARAGRRLGFDGKTLIHPNQVDIVARAFAPSDAELAEAAALIAAAKGGAERYGDRMIETMHVEQARRLLARGRPGESS